MFNLNKLYIEGQAIHGRKLFEDAEDPMRLATILLGLVTGFCAVVNFAFIIPDRKQNMWIQLTGQHDVFMAFDHYPCNYIAGFFAQFILSLYWTGTWQFVRRAHDTYTMGHINAAVFYLVWVTSWMFKIGSSCMTLGFMTPDTLPESSGKDELGIFIRNPVFIKKTSYFVLILCTLCWYFAQWVLAIIVIRVHSFHFWRFTVCAVVFFATSIRFLVLLGMGIKRVMQYQDFIDHGETEKAADMLVNVPCSSYLQTNTIWFWSMFAFVWWHLLDNWDPIAPAGDSARGPSVTMQNASWKNPPYIKVPPEDEAELAKLSEAVAHEFEREVQVRHKTVPDSNEGWGVTVGHVKAVFEIDERIGFLNPDLRTGFFAKPGRYPAIVRFNCSTLCVARASVRVYLPKDILESDLLRSNIGEVAATPRDGESQPLNRATDSRMGGDETEWVADFLFAEDLKEFFCLDVPSTIQMMKFQYKPENWSRLRWVLHTLYQINDLLKMKGFRDRQTERTAVGNRLPSSGIFGKKYFGGLPFRMGPGACKWGLIPRQRDDIGHGPSMATITAKNDTESWKLSAPVAEERYIEKANDSLKETDQVFDFAVQVATDKEYHDLTTPSAIWAEDLSPYFGVGTLTIPKEQVLQPCEKESLIFSVWHNLKEHRPIGPLNNVRHQVYKRAGSLRAQFMGQCPVTKLMMPGDGLPQKSGWSPCW